MQQTTSTTDSYIDSMVLVTPDFTRPVMALILFTCQHQLYSANSSSFSAESIFALDIDGAGNASMRMQHMAEADPGVSWGHDGTVWKTSTMHFLAQLTAGVHTLKIKWKVNNFTGSGKATVYARSFSFASLGL